MGGMIGAKFGLRQHPKRDVDTGLAHVYQYRQYIFTTHQSQQLQNLSVTSQNHPNWWRGRIRRVVCAAHWSSPNHVDERKWTTYSFAVLDVVITHRRLRNISHWLYC